MDWSAVALVIPTCDRHGGKSLMGRESPYAAIRGV
jgi:hypothetical protein